jgi:hypothetical protein
MITPSACIFFFSMVGGLPAPAAFDPFVDFFLEFPEAARPCGQACGYPLVRGIALDAKIFR